MAYYTDDMGFTASARPAPLLSLRIRATLRNWLTRFKAADELKTLPERYLHDIGVDRHDIAAAVDRAMSKLPVDEFRSRG